MTTIEITALDGEILAVQGVSATFKVFVGFGDGSELDLHIGRKLSLRTGNRVRLIFSQAAGGVPRLVSIVNLDTGRHADLRILVALQDAVPLYRFDQIFKGEGAAVSFGVFMLLTIVAVILAIFTFFLSFVALLIYSVWLSRVHRRRTEAQRQLLATRLAQLNAAIRQARETGASVTVTLAD